MRTSERLEEFFPFDSDVLERVEEASVWQNLHTFANLAEHHGIADGPEIIPAGDGHKAFELLTLKPRHDYDETHARVYHLPMSLPVDENMAMRALRLFEADSSEQLMLIGNPSAAGQPYGKLRLGDMRTVWGGDLTPVVDPLLTHLKDKGIESTHELGFSYGADKAATSAARAADHGIEVRQGVWMESAAATWRGGGIVGLAKLGIDFMSAGSELDNYVEASNSLPLNQAREEADPGMTRYILGLGRMSNLAIANALAHAGFEQRTRDALSLQPNMRTTIAWGTASELTDDTDMDNLSYFLGEEFDRRRVKAMSLEGMHHAGGDDIDLHAAIVLQALKVPAR